MQSRALARVPVSSVDSFLFTGAYEDSLDAAMHEPAIRRWAPRCARRAERFGSVCTGVFVLAALGLLDGKRVATHWGFCALLAEKFPAVRVDPNTLYVVDGKIWTSAGVTTGIDMALAMVTNDIGGNIASNIAKRFVLYVRRPGYQSQFSPLLNAQLRADDPFAELIAWLQTNLDRRLDVPSLAERVGLTERSFYRKFTASTGKTPARFIENVRLDAARNLLAQGLTLKEIAAQVGLTPPARLTKAFERRFGIAPRLFREMHSGHDGGAR